MVVIVTQVSVLKILLHVFFGLTLYYAVLLDWLHYSIGYRDSGPCLGSVSGNPMHACDPYAFYV